MSQRRSQHGFTLIEMMTVLAIVAILTISLAGLSSGQGSGRPHTTADQISGMLGFARLRAGATRTTHKVQVENNVISIWEADNTGFVTATYATKPPFQSSDVPSGVVVWNAVSTVEFAGGTNPAQNVTLLSSIEFKPDGSSSGGTIYLTDTATAAKHRIFVYRATGSAIAREGW